MAGFRDGFINPRFLADFITVVESGSISAAAERLVLTQSAVSKAIGELERDVGSPLIDRTVRPISLTRAGALLYERAGPLLAEMRNLRAATQMAAAPRLPSLRIGLVDSVMAAGPVLVQSLRALAREVRIVSGLTPELARALRRHEFDVLITSDPMENAVDLRRDELMREPFILIMPSHYAAQGENLSLDLLASRFPFVRYTTRSMIGIAIERHLRRIGLRIPPALELDHSASLLDMVSAGLGWAITTPLCLLHGRAPAATMHVRPLPGPAFSRGLYCTSSASDLPALSLRIADIARSCLRERLATAYRERGAWILDELTFPATPKESEGGSS
jgi:DNA-binding transcriptional LysR family regulator